MDMGDMREELTQRRGVYRLPGGGRFLFGLGLCDRCIRLGSQEPSMKQHAIS